ncbi:hypothetical protein ACOCJ4_12305 [Knoellia sp. CPCC 206435]|uniref:hypothetical protein n=1 Tax=Knoellia terrae TaxID=3404797 RepID=UPI003B42F70E
MDDTMLWVVGVIGFGVVLAALVWVLRHRDHVAPEDHLRAYAAPAVTGTGTPGRGGAIVGGSQPVDDTTVVDETVPLSRLGGAGWRDGGEPDPTPTTHAYAVPAEPWVDGQPGSDTLPGATPQQHVRVDDADVRPVADQVADERRGGHW